VGISIPNNYSSTIQDCWSFFQRCSSSGARQASPRMNQYFKISLEEFKPPLNDLSSYDWSAAEPLSFMATAESLGKKNTRVGNFIAT
jgi:hypothetical protein